MKRRLVVFLCVLSLVLALQPMSALAASYSGSASYASGKYYTALQKVTLTGDQRKDIVAIANSQIGYQEGGSSTQLSGEVMGGNNYTEYGKWYGLQDMWCAMFVSWCAYVAGVPSSVVPKHSYTVSGLTTFINKGQAYTRAQVASGTYKPQAGDIIYFKSSRNTNITNHVGIVTSYSGTTVYTVEGNTSSATISTNGGAVCSKSYDISNTYIVYICKPAYTTSDTTVTPPVTGGVYYPKCDYSYTSLADALRSIGVDASYAYRKVIAAANNIENYEGLPEQNTLMLSMLKEGTLINPDGTPETPPVQSSYYFPACDASYQSIANALSSIGVDGSLANRKIIAAANNIENYSGTPEQNTLMLDLLKAGKLIDPNGTPPAEPEPTILYYPACDASYESIAVALQSIGVDPSLAHRTVIAEANNIADYKGTVDQNTQMLSLLKSGELRVPDGEEITTQPEPEKPKTYPACDSSYTSIGAALSSIGVDSSYAFRKKIAAANNIADYSGTAEQNNQMLALLKAGQLLEPTEEVFNGICTCDSAFIEHICVAETCTENGAEYDRCTKCGKEGTRTVIEAPGHSYSVVVVEPTYTQEGLKTYTCSCGAGYTESIPRLPLTGDADADGYLSLKDSVLIRRYLAGWNVTVNLTLADADKDGVVTLQDVALIQRCLAGGWGVTL